MSIDIIPCDMTYTPPMDFAQCETHDTTFPLGTSCKFQGREPWLVYAEEADEQRQRAVTAEMRLEALEAGLRHLLDDYDDAADRQTNGVTKTVLAVKASRLRTLLTELLERP